jgi:hypothetical protein
MSHRAVPVVTAVIIVAFVALSPAKLPAASSCEWNNVERVVAIGDVHGAYDRFVEILKVAGRGQRAALIGGHPRPARDSSTGATTRGRRSIWCGGSSGPPRPPAARGIS